MKDMQNKIVAAIDEAVSKLHRYTAYSKNKDYVSAIAAEDVVILGMYKDAVKLDFLSHIYGYLHNSLREYVKVLDDYYEPSCTYLNAHALFHEKAAEEFVPAIDVAITFVSTKHDATFEEMCIEMSFCSVPFLNVYTDHTDAGIQRSILFHVGIGGIEIKSYSELLMYAAVRTGGYVFTFYSLDDIKTGRQFLEAYAHNEKNLSRQYAEMYNEYIRHKPSTKAAPVVDTVEGLRESFGYTAQSNYVDSGDDALADLGTNLKSHKSDVHADAEFIHSTERKIEQLEEEKRHVSNSIKDIDDRLVEVKNIFIIYVSFTLIMMFVAASYIAERLN